MNTLIYILKVSLILAILYGMFHFLFRNTKHTTHNRIYLLTGLLTAFLIPALSFHQWLDTPKERIPSYLTLEPLVLETTQDIQIGPEEAKDQILVPTSSSIDKPDLVSQKVSKSRLSPYLFILGVWMVGMIIMLFRLIFNYVSIYRLYRSGQIVADAPILLKHHPSFPTASSFFHWIFWPTPTFDPDQKLILEHELIHKHHYHSIDILIAEIAKVVLWYWPIAYLWRNAMELNHEYIVDEKLGSSATKIRYIGLLQNQVDVSSQTLTLSFASNLRKRIYRMNASLRNKLWLSFFNVPVLMIVSYLLGAAYMGDGLGEQDYKIYKASSNNQMFRGEIGNISLFSPTYNYTPSRVISGTQYDEAISISFSLTTNYEELISLLNSDINFFYKDRPIVFSKNAVYQTDKFNQPSSNNHKRFNGKFEIPEYLLDKVFDNIIFQITDPELKMGLNIVFRLESQIKDGAYIKLNGEKNYLKRLILTGDAYVSDGLIDIPDFVYTKESKDRIIDTEIMVFDEDGIQKVSSIKYYKLKKPFAVFQSIQTESQYSYILFYIIRSNYSYNKKVEVNSLDGLLPKLGGRTVVFGGGPPFKIETGDTGSILTWGKWSRVNIPLYGEIIFATDFDHFPGQLSLSQFKELLKKSPTIKHGKNSKDKIFVKLVHIKRQDLPIEYNLIYNQNTGRIEHDQDILKIIQRNVKVGDTVRLKIRDGLYKNQNEFSLNLY